MNKTTGSLTPKTWIFPVLLTMVITAAFILQSASPVRAQISLDPTPTNQEQQPSPSATPADAALTPTPTLQDAGQTATPTLTPSSMPTSMPTSMPDVSGMDSANTAAENLKLVSTVTAIDKNNAAFIDKDNGYVYLGSRLFWTSDGGKSWSEITPADLGTPRSVSIQFIDRNVGVILADQTQEDGLPVFSLFSTLDGGISWFSQPVDLPYPPDELLSFQSSSIFMLDEYTGWISLNISSGTNFSRGLLFRTDDGGASWILQDVPLGEPVYFADSQLGFIAGGPAGNQLFRTLDGGETWEAVELPEVELENLVSIQLPRIFDNGEGLLPVLVGAEEFTSMLLYQTDDGGNSWSLSTTIELQPSSAGLPITYPDKNAKKIAVANDTSIISSDGKSVTRVKAESGMNATPKDLFMFADQAGYSEVTQATCKADNPGGNGKIHCEKEYQLLRTDNGGKKWSPLALPLVDAEVISGSQEYSVDALTSSSALTASAVNTQVFIGQGFDKCEVASYDQLLTWMQESQYRAVNLYIGGISRACNNSPLTASFIHSVSLQGWKFIPTWVGPQAPCSGLKYPMSLDPATAYGEGVENAIQAVDALSLLGLTSSSKTGSVVYYDMEYYNGNDATCSAAVKSFMNGWSAQLKLSGNLSGVYATTSLHQMDNIFAAPNAPDVIWPARWNFTSYDGGASVWNIPDLSNDIYKNSQRIRQYAGGHDESWGNVTMNIDSNVLEGVIAVPNVTQPSPCPQSTNSESYACAPILGPAYTNPCTSGWYPIAGFNGLPSYLSENVAITTYPTNIALWTPNLLADGYYRVETFIASHGSSNVTCGSVIKSYGKDSSNATYVVTDKDGVKTSVTVDQLPVNNDWVDLGSYFLNKGANGGDVVIGNATRNEAVGSTNISVGAVRFIAIDPKISSISPTSKVVGNASFTLTVNGFNFNAASVVRWNGVDRPTTVVSSTMLTAQISAADIASIGLKQITVHNIDDGGIDSDPVQLGVTSFADVNTNAWYWRYVEGFYARKITTGCGSSPARYCPDNAVTRAEMAVFLLRTMNGITTPTPATTGIFSDVPVVGKEWMQPWIEEFYLEGLTYGCSANPVRYCPERKLTRAEAAVFILKARHASGYQPPAATGIFSDVPVAGKEWMAPWIEQFYREGITTGCKLTPLSFCPEDPVTRAELAAFIDRAFGIPLLP